MKQSTLVTIRLARNDDAKVVADLVACSGFVFDDWQIDWSDIHPHWLLAEHEGRPVGTIQLCYGRPIARIEILAIPESVPKRLRAAVVVNLIAVASQTMHQYGAQAVSAMIPFSLGSYKKAAKRRGWITLDSGNIMMRRLR